MLKALAATEKEEHDKKIEELLNPKNKAKKENVIENTSETQVVS